MSLHKSPNLRASIWCTQSVRDLKPLPRIDYRVCAFDSSLGGSFHSVVDR
jgi:hypothetical protein